VRALCVLAAASLSGALLSCGPYAELAQKLDVGLTIASGETWIAATGSEVRVLVLGDPDPVSGAAAFAFTASSLPIAAGVSAWATQGSWSGKATDPSLTLHERYLYRMADERGTALLNRHGTTRDDVSTALTFGQSRGGGQLVLTGDASIAGTYVLLTEAMANLGTSTSADAACAFHLANLAVLSSQVRIIGFGSAGMTQYQTAATFRGTLTGDVLVSVHGSLSATTNITYSNFADFVGVRIDGTQTTHVNAGGNGSMSGVVTFALTPQVGGAATQPPEIDGSIDYGADAIQISSGSASGGHYVVTLAGGGAASVDPVAPPSPSVVTCLGLP
jgi:hypothetical protein